MSHYKPYPAYKDSGVEWIGQVPEHWKVVRIKRTAQIATDRCNAVPAELSYIGLEDVESGSGQYKPTATASRQSDDSTVGLFQKGDVLYGKLRPYLRKCVTGPMDGACSTEFLVLKPSSVLPTWLQSWLLTQDVTQQIEAGCDGAKMPRADWEHVGSIHIPAPAKAEQDSILTVLIRETARIDALIAKKTRFIELLREKRQALITHAVAKGLNPKAKMKDSDVEWIGHVPEHWTIPALKFLVSTPITDGPHETPVPSDSGDGVLFISAEAVSSGEIDFNKAWGYISRTDHERYSNKYSPKVNDIYMVKSGATTGITAIVKEKREFNIWSPLAAIRPSEEIVPQFLLNALRSTSFMDGVKLNWSYGTQQNIGMKVLESLPVPLPPLKEQEQISTFLETNLAKLDLLTDKTRLSIDLLKQRRSALITAAVTGKIDFREDP